MLKILFLGDIVGKTGRTILKERVPTLKEQYDPDFVIANGENAAGGFGLDLKCADEIFKTGVDFITTGNHVWKKPELHQYLNKDEPRVIRPINFNGDAPGKGIHILPLQNGKTLRVINAMGRVFIPELLDCPFEKVEQCLEATQADFTLVDFHAEATSEKVAFGHFLDGKVHAVLGTHTHIQTSDEHILPGGTVYITDVGMCGPDDSVIGMNKEHVVEKFRTSRPSKFELAKGPARLNAVFLELDQDMKKSRIERIFLRG